MNVLDNDTDVLEFLDFDHSTVCENDVKECDATAEWLMWKTCCSATYTLCDPCLEQTRSVLKTFMFFRCKDCNGMIDPEDIKWSKL